MLLLLAGLILAIHRPLAFTGAVLTDYDLFTYFYPYWEYRAAMLRTGTLPLWNPYLFTGVPFLANPQAAVFYPLNWPLIWLDAPRAVAWSYLFHLWLAGAGMYLLLRRGFGAGVLAGLCAALVFSLGGVLAAQAGHINQVQAAAWLPLLVLCLLRSWSGGGVAWAAAGGACFAMQLLAGHPQQAFIAVVGLGLIALVETGRRLSSLLSVSPAGAKPIPAARRLLAPFLWLGATLLLAAALAAVQLLPTAELSRYSVRAGGLGYRAAFSFSLPPTEVLRAFLPTFGDQPAAEYIAYTGVAALVLAWQALRRPGPRFPAVLFAGITLAALLLAFGRFLPLSPLLYHVPGFDLFRAPARWLLLYGFGMAGLAALGLDRVVQAAPAARSWLPEIVVALLGAAALAFAFWRYGRFMALPPPHAAALWLAVGAVALLLTRRDLTVRWGSRPALLLLGLAAAELYLARAPLPISHPLPPGVYREIGPALAQLLQDPGTYRTLSIADPAYEPGDLAGRRTVWEGVLTDADFKGYVVASKYQELLAPNLALRFRRPSLDGYDGGVLPLRQFSAVRAAVLQSGGARQPNPEDDAEDLTLIRDRILGIPDPALLGQLNVKYVIADRRSDAWVDGVYHDLSTPQRLAAGGSIEVQGGPEPVDALSVASYLEGAAGVEQGAAVARVRVDLADGTSRTWPLRAGVETAESSRAAFPGAAHRPARAVTTRRGDPDGRVYAARLELGQRAAIRRIAIEASPSAGSLTIAGIALVDDERQAGYTPSLDPRLVRVLTGDLKVYQNLALAPKAALVPDAGSPTAAITGSATIDSYQAEQVEITTDAPIPARLVLSDSAYPGWRAWVDGREAPVEQVDGWKRSVPVPQGRHHVTFRFEPAALRAGAALSLLALALTICLSGAPLVVRRRKRDSRTAGTLFLGAGTGD